MLELWQEIRDKSALRNIAKGSKVLPDPDGCKDEGTMFDDLIEQYKELAERAEKMLIRQISGEVEADLKPHLDKSVLSLV